MDKSKKSIVLIVVISLVILFIIIGFLFLSRPDNQPAKIDFESISLTNLDDQDQQLLEQTKQALRENPDDVDALLTLANLQKWNASYEEAINTLLLAKQLNPDESVIYNNLIELYVLVKDFDKAEETALDLIDFNSQWINAYVWLERIYSNEMPQVFTTDKYPDLLKKGLAESIGNNRMAFLRLLGNYYRDIEENEEAITWYELYLEADPNDADIRQQIEELRQ